MSGSPEQIIGGWRLDVMPADPKAECVYLHVLVPADTGMAAMPACSVDAKKGLAVKVGELEYTFDEKSGAK